MRLHQSGHKVYFSHLHVPLKLNMHGSRALLNLMGVWTKNESIHEITAGWNLRTDKSVILLESGT